MYLPTDPLITADDVTLLVKSTLLIVLTLSWCWVVVGVVVVMGVAVGGDEERLEGWT